MKKTHPIPLHLLSAQAIVKIAHSLAQLVQQNVWIEKSGAPGFMAEFLAVRRTYAPKVPNVRPQRRAQLAFVDHIVNRAITPSSVRADGLYTLPRSFGVYQIPTSANTTRRYRFGNHPVRQRELEREFGSCKLEYLFTEREDAETVALALAGRG